MSTSPSGRQGGKLSGGNRRRAKEKCSGVSKKGHLVCETRKSPTTCFFTQWNLHISGRIGLNAIFSPQPNASRHLRGPGAWPRSTQSRQGQRAGSSPTAAGHGHSAGYPQAPHPPPAAGTVQATRRLLTLRPAAGTVQAGPQAADPSPHQGLASHGAELALLMDG